MTRDEFEDAILDKAIETYEDRAGLDIPTQMYYIQRAKWLKELKVLRHYQREMATKCNELNNEYHKVYPIRKKEEEV